MNKKYKIEYVKDGAWTNDGYEIHEYWSASGYYYCGTFDTREEAKAYAAKEGWEVIDE